MSGLGGCFIAPVLYYLTVVVAADNPFYQPIDIPLLCQPLAPCSTRSEIDPDLKAIEGVPTATGLRLVFAKASTKEGARGTGPLD